MQASNLFLGDFRRAVKDKALWITLIVGLVATLGLLALLYLSLTLMIAMAEEGSLMSMIDPALLEGMDPSEFEAIFSDPEYLKAALGAGAFVLPLTMIFPLIAAVAVSIFNGKDFSYNTVRNKIIAGNSRTKIYLSQLLVNCAVVMAAFCAVLIFDILLCTLMFRLDNFFLTIQQLLLAVPLYLAMTAIATFVCQSTKSRSLAIVLNTLIVFSPVILDIIISFFAFGGSGSEMVVAVLSSNPYTMLSDYVLASYETAFAPMTMLKSLLVAVLYFGGFTGLGVGLFNYTDIK